MTPAVASLVALLVAIALSGSARVNLGIAAVALAFGLGLFVPGRRADALAAAFPSSLFVTLVGVTLLFAATESNGTLARAAGQAVRIVRGDARLAPWMLLAVAFAVSAATRSRSRSASTSARRSWTSRRCRGSGRCAWPPSRTRRGLVPAFAAC